VNVARIGIGGVYASARPAMVHTVLGSCVAACLYDRVAGVGGMNHFLLPDGGEDHELPTRYGLYAMEVLVNDVMRHGGQRARFEAKIFGAAHVLGGEMLALRVSDENARFVREFLRTEGIPVTAEKLGGRLPMEVRFATHTGQAFVRDVTTPVAQVSATEAQWRKAVSRDARRQHGGDVTLF
jgi:chemotaxis protein CheD